MEQFNKALSFILGLVVVAVFIVVASGKINLKGINFPKAQTATNTIPSTTPNTTPKPTSKPWFSFSNQPTITPKVATSSTTTVATNSKGSIKEPNQQNPNYHSYSGLNVVNAPASIPNTGIPIVLFPLFGTSLITGIFMKKTGKKE
jgi:hypothetical protein